MSAAIDRPCGAWTGPRAGIPFPAYCGRCGFSRTSHDRWAAWEEEAGRDVDAPTDVSPVEGEVRNGTSNPKGPTSRL